MKIILLSEKAVKFFIALTGLLLLGTVSNRLYRPVYKDRELWEKRGSVVWEADVPEKLVTLTFDDGPSPTFTGKILDLLAGYNAKETFFVIGKQAESYPQLIRREYFEGHEIGNHTYDHREVNSLTADELRNELERAHQVIYDIIQRDMKLFRPTSGFYNEKIVKVAASLNYTVIIWTWGQDSRDWAGASGERIAAWLIKTVKPGNIIHFHDLGGDRSNTVRDLEIMLPALKEQGYRFVTVSALLQIARKGRKYCHRGPSFDTSGAVQWYCSEHLLGYP